MKHDELMDLLSKSFIPLPTRTWLLQLVWWTDQLDWSTSSSERQLEVQLKLDDGTPVGRHVDWVNRSEIQMKFTSPNWNLITWMMNDQSICLLQMKITNWSLQIAEIHQIINHFTCWRTCFQQIMDWSTCSRRAFDDWFVDCFKQLFERVDFDVKTTSSRRAFDDYLLTAWSSCLNELIMKLKQLVQDVVLMIDLWTAWSSCLKELILK